jgi:hypothetical protein
MHLAQHLQQVNSPATHTPHLIYMPLAFEARRKRL